MCIIIVLLSGEEMLLRPWCIGELVSARLLTSYGMFTGFAPIVYQSFVYGYVAYTKELTRFVR